MPPNSSATATTPATLHRFPRLSQVMAIGSDSAVSTASWLGCRVSPDSLTPTGW